MVSKLKKILLKGILCTMLVVVLSGCASADSKTEETNTADEVVTEATPEEVAEEATEPEDAAPKAETEEAEPENPSTDIFIDSGISKFAVTSADLHDGVWDTVITKTEKGSNVSPQLSWEPVEGAQCYVIYMVDKIAGDWIHWISNNVTETELAQGWAPEGEYVGPYPPGGTHDYEIYVVALKQPVERAKGALNSSNLKFKPNVFALDEATEGETGNIVGYGYITGTYTYGD